MDENPVAPWQSSTIGALCEMQLGKMLSASTRIGPRQRPFLANRNVQWNKIDFTDIETMHFSFSEDRVYSLKSGDVLVCEGGEIGRTALWAGELEDCHFQNAVHRLRPRDGVLLPRYLLHFMRFAADHGLFRRFSGQTSIAHLTKVGLRQITVPLPSVTDQRRIAEILDTIDEAIRSTERVISKLEQMKQGVLHDLLTRGIDGHGELRDQHRHPEHFADTPLGSLPNDWVIERCSDLCREIVVGIVIRPTQWYAPSGISVLRSANVREDGIDMSDLVFMTEPHHRALAKSAVSPGDVVTVRTGYPGTTAVIPDTVHKANCVDIIISRPGPRLESEYLSMWVNAPIGKEQILAKQGGLAQQHFNVGEMKELLVALPPLAEQRAICARVAALRERIGDERTLLDKLILLKNGLMDDLLTGRVRVKIDDEEAA